MFEPGEYHGRVGEVADFRSGRQWLPAESHPFSNNVTLGRGRSACCPGPCALREADEGGV
ncbi:hypothetical protein GCM10010170_074100 [Dactylosporangium salmoneum]|uniref:Uncharacterized protein n=1 Tax=Dactylosporangium salmoneum TaxID=53361 RepID=A0ABN3H883_9ACTN